MISTILAAAGFQATAFVILPILGSVLLAYGIYQVVAETRANDKKRLADRLEGASRKQQEKMASILKSTAREEAKEGLFKAIDSLSFIPKLQTLLDQANVDMMASKLFVNLLGLAAVSIAGLIVFDFSPVTAIMIGFGIFILPLMILQFKRKRRMAKLTYQLPDVFEMMGQALRAGHSLPGCFQLIHEQMPDPIGTEFGRVFYEQNLGLKIEDALLDMADRVDSMDVRFFVTAVLIQRQTGGDLAEVLDNIGGLIRQRIELFGMVKGLTAEGRLSGWVLFALPFLVFFAVQFLNPDYGASLLEDSRGKILLCVAAGMQLMGLAMIRHIVNIKV